MTDGKAAANRIYKKLAVQWLNEALCFAPSSVLADRFVLRNRQLLKPAKRCEKTKFLNYLDPFSALQNRWSSKCRF
jgi:hypothetical protein